MYYLDHIVKCIYIIILYNVLVVEFNIAPHKNV